VDFPVTSAPAKDLDIPAIDALATRFNDAVQKARQDNAEMDRAMRRRRNIKPHNSPFMSALHNSVVLNRMGGQSSVQRMWKEAVSPLPSPVTLDADVKRSLKLYPKGAPDKPTFAALCLTLENN
jgi:hypothetical protein